MSIIFGHCIGWPSDYNYYFPAIVLAGLQITTSDVLLFSAIGWPLDF